MPTLSAVFAGWTYIASTVDGKAVTGSQKDQTERGTDGHQKETFRTTPSIHQLSHGEEDSSRESIGHRGRETRQRVCGERTRDIGVQAVEHSRLECIHKVQEPNAADAPCVS